MPPNVKDKLPWAVCVSKLNNDDIYEVRTTNNRHEVVLNVSHPFYKTYIHPFAQKDVWESILISLAKSELSSDPSVSESVVSQKELWSKAMELALTQ